MVVPNCSIVTYIHNTYILWHVVYVTHSILNSRHPARPKTVIIHRILWILEWRGRWETDVDVAMLMPSVKDKLRLGIDSLGQESQDMMPNQLFLSRGFWIRVCTRGLREIWTHYNFFIAPWVEDGRYWGVGAANEGIRKREGEGCVFSCCSPYWKSMAWNAPPKIKCDQHVTTLNFKNFTKVWFCPKIEGGGRETQYCLIPNHFELDTWMIFCHSIRTNARSYHIGNGYDPSFIFVL